MNEIHTGAIEPMQVAWDATGEELSTVKTRRKYDAPKYRYIGI
jgi:hypothetical protein